MNGLQIPQNAGNAARTCAATGVPLHLVQPLGFSLDSAKVGQHISACAPWRSHDTCLGVWKFHWQPRRLVGCVRGG
jgi:tRNA(Leu) C34 or U34 (ribose-2'-O)-methylase TrmL